MRLWLLIVALLIAIGAPAVAGPCPAPHALAFVVEKIIRRDVPGFTEGLEVQNGALLESTGDLFGDSRINRIDPVTGKVQTLINAGKSYFGEGLTAFGGKLYQMTWREHRVLVFGAGFKPLAELTNPREGWGLTHDSQSLIASDGSSQLFFLSPRDFSTLATLNVTEDGHPVDKLNELEWAQGVIWANVFETWSVVRISPATGCVEGRAELSSLKARMRPDDLKAIGRDENFVPNGIAYDAASGLFTVTGKYWPMLFSGHFVED